MITLVTVPKPFNGLWGRLQESALASWRAIGPELEILLVGDTPGVAAAAERFGARHVPEVECNEFGTPYLSSVFDLAFRLAEREYIGFVNTDIVLLPDFRRLLSPRLLAGSLCIGRRSNVEPIDVELLRTDDWGARLAALARRTAVRGPANALDYFLFPRERALMAWPPFLIGRGVWDNWFIYHAHSLGFRVIDASRVVSALHQNHDYSHIHRQRGSLWHGPEADWNQSQLDRPEHAFSLFDATHVMAGDIVLPAWGCRYLERRFQRWRANREVVGRQTGN